MVVRQVVLQPLFLHAAGGAELGTVLALAGVQGDDVPRAEVVAVVAGGEVHDGRHGGTGDPGGAAEVLLVPGARVPTGQPVPPVVFKSLSPGTG